MIAVLTAPRPGRSYLADTLQAIDSSATGRRVLVVDHPRAPDGVPEPWQVLLAPRPVAPAHNKYAMWRAIGLAADAGEDLVFFEDDVALCRNAALWAERLRVPDDLGIVMLYSPWADPGMPWALWRGPMRVFNFCQGLKFSARACRDLWERREWMAASGLGGSDEVIREIGIFGKVPWGLGVMHPGIVQHVGDHSAVGNGGLEGSRVSRAFAGESFDALSLDHDHYR